MNKGLEPNELHKLKSTKVAVLGVVIIQLILLVTSIINPNIGTVCRLSISAIFSLFIIISSVKMFRINSLSWTIVSAVIFCFSGDFILAGLTPIPDGLKLFSGIGMFSLAQVSLILTFIRLKKKAVVKVFSKSFYKALTSLIITIITIIIIILIYSETEVALLIALFIYASLIAFMSSLAMSLKDIATSYLYVGIGSLLFFASDMIIALVDIAGFVTQHKDNAIWITYTLGLMGVFYGLVVNHRKN